LLLLSLLWSLLLLLLLFLMLLLLLLFGFIGNGFSTRHSRRGCIGSPKPRAVGCEYFRAFAVLPA